MIDSGTLSFRDLTKKVGIIGFSRFFLALSTILINAILSRLFEKELYGTYQLAMIVFRIFSLIFIFGVPTSLFFFLPRLERDAERKGLLLHSLYSLIGLGAIIAVLVYFSSGLLGTFFRNGALPAYLKIVSLYIFFTVVVSYSDALFITLNRHKLLAVVTICFSGITCAAVWAAATTGSIERIFAAITVVAGLKLLAILFFTKKILPRVKAEWNVRLLLSQILYILPIGLNGIIDVVSKWLDKTLVSYFFPPDVLAVYANGAMEIPFIGILVGAITAVIMPQLSARFHTKDYEGFISLWNKAIYLAAIVLFPLFVFLMIMAKDVMVFLYSSTYESSTTVFRIYLLLIPVRIIAFTPILYAMGKSKIVMVGAILDLVVNFILSLILIKFLHEKGPAVATVVATFLQVGFYLYHIQQFFTYPLHILVKIKDIVTVFGISLFCICVIIPFLYLPLTSFQKVLLASLYFPFYYFVSRRWTS